MRVDRGAVRVTALVIAAVMVASGPLVPAVDFTHTSDAPAIGGGTVRFSVEHVPVDGVRLERARFGAGRYVLRVPDAVVRVYALRGHPSLLYRVDVPALGYAYASTTSLGDRHAGRRVNLSLAPDAVDPDRVTREAYPGTVAIIARDGDGRRVRYRANVTIEVID